jgi:hypothetical protein
MKDPSAREELIEKYGRMATPTLVIGDKVILGFRLNQDEIEREITTLKEDGNG